MSIPYWIESLVFSFRDSIVGRVGSERTVYYHFLESVPTGWTSNNTGFTPFNENQRSFIKSAFDYFSTIIDLKFVETKTYDSFNTVVLGNNDQGGSGSAGYMTGAPGDEAWGMFISNVHPNATSLLNPQNSSWVPQTYIHELGHVLGLKHPFGNTLPILSDAEDNFDLTVMTYGSRSPGIAAPVGIQLQPLDIAALQYLYGPSKIAANATTDNSYTLDASGRNFIWDGGGIDLLDASSADRRLVLDLEPLTQGYFGASPGSLISDKGQVTINRGTAIEGVSATRFDDIIFGNNLGNRFFPNGGIDSIDSRDGNDTVILPINSSDSKLYREENALVIVSPDGSIVRLKNVETVRYKDGDRNASDLINSPSTVSVPFHSTLNAPIGVQTDKFTLTYNFNEAVSGLTPSDFSITSGEIKSISGSGKTYLVTVAPSAGVFGVMTLQLSAASVTALSGVTNLTTPPQYFQIDTAPVRLSTDPASATVTNSTIMLKFDATLSVKSGEVVVRAASGAEVERLSLSDTSRFTQKGDVLYLYLKTEISDGSILSVNIPAGSILDLNGNSISYTITTSPSQTVKTVGTDGADTKSLGLLSDVYDGRDGDDRIWGEEGNDTIYGGAGNDRLNGMQGDDKLFGGDGDDLLLGGTGDDYFDGGSGTDTVDYNASFGILSKDATITKTAEGYTVKTASEGTDRLKDVETIKFADKLITLDNTHTSATNNAPIFASPSQTVSATAGIARAITLAATDVDGDALSYTVATPGKGTASISGSTLTYTPGSVATGTDSFVVTARDPSGAIATQTIDVTFAASNIVITVRSDGYSNKYFIDGIQQATLQLYEGNTYVFTYPSGHPFALSTTSNGTHGGGAEYTTGVTRNSAANTLTITVASGAPVLYYYCTVHSGMGGQADTPTAANAVPIFTASSQSVSTDEDTAKTINVAATDADNDALTYTVSTAASRGTTSISGGTITYTPSKDYNGNDSFVVTASDGKGGTAAQTINMTVTPVNDAPTFLNGLGQRSSSVIATPDIQEDAASYDLGLTGLDVDGDTLSYSITSAPSNGTAVLGTNRVTYTPAKDYNGKDSFVVTATDGKGGTATLTANVSVAAVNDAPFHLTNNNPPVQLNSVLTSRTVSEDTQTIINLVPFEDVEGDKLSYSVSVAPTSGTAEIVTGVSSSGAPSYSVRYTPKANFNGTDKVVVTISDGKGGTATQTINMSVTPVNDAPVFAAASQAVSATAGAAKTIALAATDVDGDALIYAVATPGKGIASISGSTLTYTPSSTATGIDSFVVTASDGKGGTATQTINATVAVVSATAAKAFIVNTLPGWVGSVGGNGSIVGSNGFEDIKVLYGQIALDGSFNRGGDIVRVSGNADSYVIGRTSASSAYIEAGTTTKVTIPIGSTGMGIVYDDGVRKLSFSSGAYKIGNQIFTAEPTKITSAADGTVLPTGANPDSQAFVSLLTAGLSGGNTPDLTITGKVRIAGTNGVDVIKLGSTGGDLIFDGSFNRGGDIIILNKAAGDYSAAKFNASTIVITSGIEKLTIPMGSAGLTLRFTDGDRTLIFKNSAFNIGDQIISSATATPLTPSTITLSADQGVTGNSAILDATGKVIVTDDATKTSNVILKNFGTDDVIRVTGATASQYNFAISALDPKDLEITYTDAVTSATNTIVLDDVIKADAFIADYATASTALGWNFMAFG